MANVNFFSPDGGTTRYPLEDTEGRTTYEEEIHGVNLFNVTAVSQTKDGVTWNISNGKITANGTSADGRITLGRVELDVGTYKLNGSLKSPSLYDWRLSLFDPNTDFVIAWDDGEGATFTVNTKKTYELQIRYAGSVTFNNVVFMPMIRKADIDDSTYRPYNPQAIQNQLNAQGVLGAKNLIPFPYKDKASTFNGVTYTYEESTDPSILHTIKANGTATSMSWRTLLEDFSFLELGKKYRLSGCPKGGSSRSYLVQVTYNDGIDKFIQDYGDGMEFIYTGDFIRLQVIVKENYTANNLVFKPMITLASDPLSDYEHYVPHAMTNRELTETVNGKNVTVLVHSSQSSNVTLENTTFARLRGSLLAFKFRFTTTSEIAPAQNIAYIALDFYPAIRAQNIVGLNVTTGGVAIIDIAGYSNNKNLYFQSRATIPADTTISISGVIDIG